MKKIIGIAVMLLAVIQSQAQRSMEGDTTWINFNQSVKNRSAQARKRVDEFCQRNNIPRQYRSFKGDLVVMVDVSETGMPLYKTVDNANAAITTGVMQLRQGGSLGLNLQGEDMIVSVWDGGIVKNHVEISGRILNTEGAVESTHATHVTGTILATGVTAKAKGMAPLAKAYTYDFDNDESEMAALARPDQSGTVLSNHSYGLITGWYYDGSWRWYGDPNVSNDEDYKFGFYSTAAKTWDDIAYNAPYYTIVKSAGNDRTDRGQDLSNHPADCNAGTGYDCISDASTAKNIITIGAVEKVLAYTGPASVKMSTFSSRGPTDDGRIKPDIVADGVDIYSLSADGVNQYTTLSGTSMASPNATGSLLLVQQLAKRIRGGNMLKAATLKNLAIHTAKEAGIAPGPDYVFGWGLLDVEAASRLLLEEDGVNTLVLEKDLLSGQSYDVPLDPKLGTKIMATLVWNDPSGTPVSVKLDPTNRMLVNDLDLVLVDDVSNSVYPWILDPENPTAVATKGNNIRDNVEKIEFDSPQPRRYTLRVSHKGTLANGHQNFSLIITYSSVSDDRITYYWIGNGGAWNNPAKWSLTSGGAGANKVPGAEDKVVFDENSFTANGATVTLPADASCASLTWLSQKTVSLSLGDADLTIGGNCIITSPNLGIPTYHGNIVFNGAAYPESQVSVSGNSIGGNLRFDNMAATWNWSGNADVSGITLEAGNLHVRQATLTIDSLYAYTSPAKSLSFENAKLAGLAASHLDGTYLDLTDVNTTITSAPDAYLHWENIVLNGTLNLNGSAWLIGNSRYNRLLVDGDLRLTDSNTIAKLGIAGTGILFGEGSTQTITDSLGIQSSAAAPVALRTTNFQPAYLDADIYSKLCFDYLTIDNVNATGRAVLNAGMHSTVTDSDNWQQKDCENVLYAKFESAYNCLDAHTEFNNLSEGNVDTWHWNFGDPQSGENESAEKSPSHIYRTVGNYTVTLTITRDGEEQTYTQQIDISANDLPDNRIVLSSGKLNSFRSAAAYQWYKDGKLVEGATERAFDYTGEDGTYTVVIKNETCNRMSESYVVTAVATTVVAEAVQLYPNPADQSFKIRLSQRGMASVKITDPLGKIVLTGGLQNTETEIPVHTLLSGIYVVTIVQGNNTWIKKLIKR